jgi:hypothetical protein
MTSTTLDRIIEVASEAYPDGLVALYHEELDGNHGDTLAKFVAVELGETFEDGCTGTESDAFEYAATRMERAIEKLQGVVDALRRESDRLAELEQEAPCAKS